MAVKTSRFDFVINKALRSSLLCCIEVPVAERERRESDGWNSGGFRL